MPANNIKAVVFDCFGVIVPDYGLDVLNSARLDTALIAKLQKLRALTDLGEITDTEFASAFEQLTGKDYSINARLKSCEQNLNGELLKVIARLHKKYKIGMLSNAHKTYFNLVMKRCELTKYFDKIVVSSEVEAVKPEPRIFEIMAKKLNAGMNEVVFIDDRTENVKAARQLGMVSFLYKGVKNIEIELKKLGITP